MIMEGNASSNSQSVAGFLVKPGDWFATYPGREINKFAEVDRRIFSLDPRRDFLAACIAFYLVERWHALANRVSLEESEKDLFQPYRVPIAMRDLLAASMIEIDKINLTSRFVERIEAALNKLFERHILAAQPVCLSSINKSGYWGRDWLASLWQLLPTLEMADAYQQAIRQKHVRRDGTSD